MKWFSPEHGPLSGQAVDSVILSWLILLGKALAGRIPTGSTAPGRPDAASRKHFDPGVAVLGG
jgi:hypothetical protein